MTNYFDIDMEWFKSREVKSQLILVLGILSATSFRVIKDKDKGMAARACASHPKVFDPVIYFFSEHFPPTINSATKESRKNGGHIYRNPLTKKFMWHITGRKKIDYIIKVGNMKFDGKNIVPEDACEHCGFEDGTHDKECYTLQA